jgi:hypothetical protein
MENEMTKYSEMSPGDMLQAVGDDAQKWADAFCEINPDADRETMVGWFANAIENSSDVRRGRHIHSDEAFCNYAEDVLIQRRFLRDLRS